MVKEAETVRHFSEEQRLVVDYEGGDPANTYWTTTTSLSSQFEVDKPCILVFKAGFTLDATGVGGTRVSVGSPDLRYIGGMLSDVEGDHEYCGIAYIDEGVYDFKLEGYQQASDVSGAWCKVGITNFKDLDGVMLSENKGVAIAAGANATMIDEDISGTVRNCSIGTVRRHIIRLQVLAMNSGGIQGVFKDAGDSPGSGMDIYITKSGGVGDEVDWTVKHNDLSSMIAGAAYGEYVWVEDMAVTSNRKVIIFNRDIYSFNFDVYWSIAACPWFGCDEYEAPVAINIPSQSNINVLIEPLDDDLMKYISLGTFKALGESEVYDPQSGTGIVSLSDTLAELPDYLRLFTKGLRSAVTVIHADRR